MKYHPIKIQFRESDLQIASIFTGMSKNHVLYYVMLTAREIEGQYYSRISEFKGWPRELTGFRCNYFNKTRIIKSKGQKGKGLPLRYTMFYKDDELHVQVKTVRSNYPKRPYTEKEIFDAFYADEIEDMLI